MMNDTHHPADRYFPPSQVEEVLELFNRMNFAEFCALPDAIIAEMLEGERQWWDDLRLRKGELSDEEIQEAIKLHKQFEKFLIMRDFGLDPDSNTELT